MSNGQNLLIKANMDLQMYFWDHSWTHIDHHALLHAPLVSSQGQLREREKEKKIVTAKIINETNNNNW